MRRFGHEELPRNLHLGRLRREVAEEAALLLDEEELGQLLGLGLQDLDPLLQLGDQIVELHGARHAEVEIWKRENVTGLTSPSAIDSHTYALNPTLSLSNVAKRNRPVCD